MKLASGLLLAILLAANASADTAVEIEAFLERYEAALDHTDPAALSELHAEPWTAARQQRLAKYFAEVVAEFNVEISELEIGMRGAEGARVRFLRADSFTSRDDGRRVRKQIRLQRVLQRVEGAWKFAAD